jgi:hypothetical protein
VASEGYAKGQRVKVFKRPYRHYNRLVEICFAISALWFVLLVVGWIVPGPSILPQPVKATLRIVFNLNILLAIFVVTARFMRDEYAERIWQQTARRFVNFMMIGPLMLTILILLNTKRISAALPGMMPPRMLEILASADQPAVVFFGGIAATFLMVAQFVPQLFVIFYRWGLWRDSR